MKRLLVIFSLAFLSNSFLAQQANDWIDYSSGRFYFAIPIAEDGLYRISEDALSFALQSAGQNINNIDPRSIQLFGRGTEQYIHIEGGSDGSFDANDFIEFYGQRNDGWLDSNMYPSADQQTNPYYSLYNDTARYFLTWHIDGSFSPFRYESVPFTGPVSNTLQFVFKTDVSYFSPNVNAYAYYKGRDIGGGKSKTEYHGGKGWMSNRFGHNNGAINAFTPVSFDTPNAFNGNGAPTTVLEFGLAGVNRGAGTFTDAHHARVIMSSNGSTQNLADLIYDEYSYDTYAISIPSSSIGSTTSFRFSTTPSITPIAATSDYSAISFLRLTYPSELSFSGVDYVEFEVDESPLTRFLNAIDFSIAQTDWLYDLGQHKRYQVNHSTATGNVTTNIPSGARRKMVLSTNAAIEEIAQAEIEPVNQTGTFTNISNLETDSAYIIVTHKRLRDAANTYASYRASDFNTVVLDIEELYAQFAFGIRKHPLAIRNFMKMAIETWSTSPSYLFIIGKGIEEPTIRNNSNFAARSLVPAMGFPVSDAMLTAGLNGFPGHVQAVPVGRLAARTSSEVNDYLDKIRSFEQSQSLTINPYTIRNRKWQKQILHFAGGDDANENNRFKSYLSDYQNFAEDSLFGGKIHLFSKTSGETFEELNSELLSSLLSEGSAVMTFFGHASGNSFDISVDDPSNWNNPGRYPLVIANSCFTGNIHLPVDVTRSISEDYLFTPNEGAIGFLATPDLSLELPLHRYTRELYHQFSNDNYGKSIGQQMRATNAAINSNQQNDGIALEMTLHGDPAIHLYPHGRTEMSINDPELGASVTLIPEEITSDIDSFTVEVLIHNLGKSGDAPFSVTATRSFPNGKEDEFQTRQVTTLDYEATVQFTFATDAENGLGENRLEILIDLPISQVEEFIETSNNTVTTLSFFISSSDVFPVFPYDNAVVPDFNQTLRANTGFPLLDEKEYVFELDTTDLYNSPFKVTHEMRQASAVLEWDPNLVSYGFEDSTVIFWRVAPKDDQSKWQEHSFQVIPNQHGWGQEHFFQFEQNQFDLLNYERNGRRFEFPEASRELFVQNVGNPVLGKEDDDVFYKLDGQGAPLGEWGIASVRPTLAVVVIDSTTLRPWGTYGIGTSGAFENQDKRFGNSNDGAAHRSRVEYYFTFELTGPSAASQWSGFTDMIDNHVEDGHYLLIYTMNRGLFDSTAIWPESKLSFIEALGADSIRDVGNLNPYIFLVKKGYPETSSERLGKNSKDIIQMRETIFSNFRLGSMQSTRIGPSMSWEDYRMTTRTMEASSDDSIQVSFTAINGQGDRTEMDTLFAEGEESLTNVDATELPYADLLFYTEDNTNLTPSQLRNWHVLYDPAPEASINPIRGAVAKETMEISAGTPLPFGFAVENISAYDFGEFFVTYQLIDATGDVIQERELGYDGLSPQEIIFDSVQFETSQLGGRYIMFMEVNPRDDRWHPEQYHFNNRLYLTAIIKADRKKPLLDVTFDGVHILSGDIVSPTPEIIMELKDENTFLLMDDTNAFDVFIASNNGIQRRIPFIRNGSQIMQFEPAVAENNKARILYRPKEAFEDGNYELFVMGRDASGNESGQDAYRIQFQVINRSAVTNVVNYPNPFSTSTRFVFTLTGAQIPDVFTIQIMTVTGKVIREITKDELGPINIGRNMTEYAWDGTDEYGDQLANGVYLYRVIMKIDGKSMDRLNTGADEYFTKDFGKMYLFR